MSLVEAAASRNRNWEPREAVEDVRLCYGDYEDITVGGMSDDELARLPIMEYLSQCS